MNYLGLEVNIWGRWDLNPDEPVSSFSRQRSKLKDWSRSGCRYLTSPDLWLILMERYYKILGFSGGFGGILAFQPKTF